MLSPRKYRHGVGNRKISAYSSKIAKKSSDTLEDKLYGAIGTFIPSCADALRLVELGKERPLKLHERFELFYNSPLCLHCNCNRDKFDKERARMKEIERERKS